MNGSSLRWQDPMQRAGLIRTISRTLMVLFAVAVIVFLFFDINDSIDVGESVLVTEPRSVIHKAPYAATIESVAVEEGDRVEKGDTLLTMNNPSVASGYRSIQNQYEHTRERLKSLPKQIKNVRSQLQTLQRQAEMQVKMLQSEIKIEESSVRGLKLRLASAREQTQLAHEQFRRDSTLLAKGFVARSAYDESRRSWLESNQRARQLQSELEAAQAQHERAELDPQDKRNAMKKEALQVEAELLQLLQRQQDLKAQAQRQKNELGSERQRYQERVVTADIKGVVQQLYDFEGRPDRLSKGEELAVVTPAEGRIYARLKLEQAYVDEVAVGQKVHLQLDPYSHYKYGVVRGRVRRLEFAGGPGDSFYAIASIEAVPEGITLKPGFEARAEIIRQRMPLYAYALKYLFQQSKRG